MTSSERLERLRSLAPKKSKKGYLWVTLALFLTSLSAHWAFAWFAYVEEQNARDGPILGGDYFNRTLRDTMENWQSEFLQLIWQVAGLSFLWYVGSPQSKEGDDRLEAKVDYLLRKMDPHNAEKFILEAETKNPKK
jgi:hypothetical protein